MKHVESSFDVDTFDVVREQSQENEGFDIQSVHEGKKPHECEHCHEKFEGEEEST